MNNDIKNALVSGIQPGQSGTFRTITTNAKGGDVRCENITVYRDAESTPWTQEDWDAAGGGLFGKVSAVVAFVTVLFGFIMSSPFSVITVVTAVVVASVAATIAYFFCKMFTTVFGIYLVVKYWGTIVMLGKFVLWVAAVVAIVGVAYFIYTLIDSSEKELDKDENN